MFQVNKGKVEKALKVVIYGPEGVGKSTLASQFPNPIFIDTEGSTDHMDVNRLKRPSSYHELIQMINWVKSERQYSTLIIDTADWAQTLVEMAVIQEYNVKSIEEPAYGKGYVWVRERFGQLINVLSDVIDAGINVVLTAHSEVVRFDDPSEINSYSRYELKLAKRSNASVAAIVKEWADMILFINYEVIAVKGEDARKTAKAQGGHRVIHTTHHPAWDAKNRFGLPDKMSLDYANIAAVVPDLIQQPSNETKAENTAMDNTPYPFETNDEPVIAMASDYPDYLPQQLTDLMRNEGVTVDEIIGVMGIRGHFPINTDLQVIAERTPDYFTNGLAANWDGVISVVHDIRSNPNQLVELWRKVGDEHPEETVKQMNLGGK